MTNFPAVKSVSADRMPALLRAMPKAELHMQQASESEPLRFGSSAADLLLFGLKGPARERGGASALSLPDCWRVRHKPASPAPTTFATIGRYAVGLNRLQAEQPVLRRHEAR